MPVPPVPTWNTITYLGEVTCETCGWCPSFDAAEVGRARHAARRHVRANPGHRVRVGVGKTTVYGESEAS
jgi:hypothetical protein